MSNEKAITLFWFRRDLRLHDNHGLYKALKESGNVQPLFIFDTAILDKLEDRTDRRVSFLFDRTKELGERLKEKGAVLWMERGRPIEVITRLIKDHPVKAIFTNHDHEPYARKRDEQVRALLEAHGVAFHTFKDQTVFEREEVVKDDGTPYTVFTPYARKWRERLKAEGLPAYPSEQVTGGWHRSTAQQHTELSELGFERAAYEAGPMEPAADLLKRYAARRNTPGVVGTSRIGVHLRFGTVSVRDMVRLGLEHSSTWLNELIWREFFMQILWHFPHVEHGAFRKEYDAIPWRDDEAAFNAWCEGRTGYPLVDAGMRELLRTGFMHNRVRMVTASFLCKHLLINWQLGEAWFARWLMDFDLASNNGNWQWAAGSGCDAAPYFRVFNPTLQLQRFDPKMAYVHQWAPEYGELQFPHPIVDHAFARNRAIATYKQALNAR
ncbi:MAG: deoxyribodipyrimidine photo-lyase [Flavobacteriales bacterium]